MTSGIIKVKASVITRGQKLRLIALAETLIILDITKTEFNYIVSFYYALCYGKYTKTIV